MRIKYLFMNAGIRFFRTTKDDGKKNCLAILRDRETNKLMCVYFQNITSQKRLNERGLRSLESLSDRYRKPITEFKYSDYDFTPDFEAKRQLSALQLNMSIPSVRAVPEYLDNMRAWAKKRNDRSLDTNDINQVISLLSAFITKTPRELLSKDFYYQMHSVSLRTHHWIENRKKYRLRVKEMIGIVKCIDNHIEALY